jgi:hypothetical protein
MPRNASNNLARTPNRLEDLDVLGIISIAHLKKHSSYADENIMNSRSVFLPLSNLKNRRNRPIDAVL